jgi:predicted DNA-binding transcriptional regulator YafY
MDRFDRIFALHQILRTRRTPVSRRDLEEKLECSRATVKRLIEDLRDFLGAPVVYDRDRNGYYYDRTGSIYELPGLWFSSEELFALLTTHKLLAEVQPGLLGPHLAPLRERLDRLLANPRVGNREIARRIRILQMTPRAIETAIFRKIASALVRRRRVRVLYHGRARDETTERWISPQRLVYYRDNWYLDAWCHLRRALRSFALERIHFVEEGGDAEELTEETLDHYYTSSYGIFSGEPTATAVLRFAAAAARWVADETWHPKQEKRVLRSGEVELRIPYSDPRELVRDILRHGADVEVLAPPELRAEVAGRLRAATALYATAS